MDIFLGVLANAVLVIAGGGVGCLFKGEKIKIIGQRIFEVYALFILAMGVNGAADLSKPLVILVSLIVGVAIGELVDLDKQFNRFGNWVQSKLIKTGGNDEKIEGAAAETFPKDNTFARGFVESSLLFCIGSMTFMGAMESALSHTHTIYLTKGVLDCISAMTLAMGLGVGVLLSCVSIIVYQGLLVALAALMQGVLTTELVGLCTTIGSLFLIAIGTNMIGLTKIKVANFLPAMFIPIILSFLPFAGI